jgi:anti-sigma B factor antagonist
VEIITRADGDVLELEIQGRLDAYWAGHLTSCLEDVIRGGHHRIRLELSKVAYISSAGIGVLVQYYKQLHGLQGALLISNPSRPVQKVLELTRLRDLLGGGEPSIASEPDEKVETGSAAYTLSRLTRHPSMACAVVGEPGRIAGCRFTCEDFRRLRCTPGTVALGIGAFGEEYDVCRDRFGEFFVVAGAAAHMPTDGTNVPDYMLPAENFVPELAMLYGLVCEGNFAVHARFDTNAERPAVDLSALARDCLDLADGNAAVLVIVAESAGLLGTALRRSPAHGPRDGAPFSYPEIREWLSFSPERLFTRSVALVVGVVTRETGGPLGPVVRPLAVPGLAGHFHAGAFSYRPLKKAQTVLPDSVRALFEGEVLEGVLHLLTDDRGNAPRAESRLLRGACWISPLTKIATEGNGL